MISVYEALMVSLHLKESEGIKSYILHNLIECTNEFARLNLGT